MAETADSTITLDDGSEARLLGVTTGGDFSKLEFHGVQGDGTFPIWFNEYEHVFERTDDDPYAVEGIYGEDEEAWEHAADEELAWYGLKLGEWHKMLKVGEIELWDCYDLVQA